MEHQHLLWKKLFAFISSMQLEEIVESIRKTSKIKYLFPIEYEK